MANNKWDVAWEQSGGDLIGTIEGNPLFLVKIRRSNGSAEAKVILGELGGYSKRFPSVAAARVYIEATVLKVRGEMDLISRL